MDDGPAGSKCINLLKSKIIITVFAIQAVKASSILSLPE